MNQLQKPIVPILIGAGIGFGLMAFFLLTAGEPNPEWSPYWRIRPMVVETSAGAFAGFIFYALRKLRAKGRWKALLANALSLLVLLFCLWIGSVIGLNGTYWH